MENNYRRSNYGEKSYLNVEITFCLEPIYTRELLHRNNK